MCGAPPGHPTHATTGNETTGAHMPSTATSTWTGALKEGAGKIKLGNGAFEGDYSFKSRFEDGKEGTNPEELIAAAHSACFSMATTSELGKAGIDSESVE